MVKSAFFYSREESLLNIAFIQEWANVNVITGSVNGDSCQTNHVIVELIFKKWNALLIDVLCKSFGRDKLVFTVLLKQDLNC